MNHRTVLWAVLVIGLALVIAPLALSLPSKASAGERMLGDFQPIMRADQVDTTAYYYDSVFTPLGRVVPAMSAQNVARLQQDVNGLKNVSPTTMQDFNGMLTLMKANEKIFAQVPAGLTHYKPLVRTMQANVSNYKKVNSLPSFRLFTWFFVVPGILLVLLASLGLYGERHEIHFFHRHARPTPA
jgi:hypothetical protein